MFFLKPLYESKVTFFIISNSADELNIPGSLQSAASLAGVSLGGSQGDETNKALAVLRSSNLAVEFVKNKELVDELFRSSWRLQFPELQKNDPPSDWEIAERWFDTVASVNRDDDSGLTTLSVRWEDAATSAQIAQDYFEFADNQLRKRRLKDARQNLAYLETQLEKYRTAQIRETIARMMENELQKEMMAQSSTNFAFEIIDRPIAPDKPAFPRPLLFIIGFLVLGLVISVNLALVLAYKDKRKLAV